MKKKILFMIDRLEGGGAQKVLFNIIYHLNKNKFEVHLLSFLAEGYYSKHIPKDVKHWSIFRDPATLPKGISFLYRLYRRSIYELFCYFPFLYGVFSRINEKYDIGISFCEGHNTALLNFKRKLFKRTIAWVHIDLSLLDDKIAHKHLCNYASSFDVMYFVSEDARRAFVTTYPQFEKKSNIEVVYNPIDTKEIMKQTTSENIRSEGMTILAIGRLSAQKRFDKLINVHKKLLDKGIKHQVWILGEGSDRKMLETQIKQLDVKDTCHLLGYKNPYPYLRRADIFVMTSDYEGLPVVICEAMVLSRPIVSTKITGPVELLENGKYGLLIDKTEEGIESGLEKMILDSELRKSYQIRLSENQGKFIFPTTIQHIEDKLN
jgi:Glycosyltransferase